MMNQKKNEEVTEKTVIKPLKDQINDFLLSHEAQIESLKFGQLTFEIREGKVYRLLVTSSVLVKN